LTQTTKKQPNNPRVLGLTGPTGSGKSVLTEALKALGAAVVDADAVARMVVKKGSPCLAALVDEFGEGILKPDGTLNRRALAAIAFSSDEKAKILADITHPFIVSRMRDEMRDAAANGASFIVLDAPLLFEARFDGECDKTLALLAPRKTRLARICARDNLSKSEATARIARQPKDEYYRFRADRAFQNDGDIPHLQAAAPDIVQWLMQESRHQ